MIKWKKVCAGKEKSSLKQHCKLSIMWQVCGIIFICQDNILHLVDHTNEKQKHKTTINLVGINISFNNINRNWAVISTFQTAFNVYKYKDGRVYVCKYIIYTKCHLWAALVIMKYLTKWQPPNQYAPCMYKINKNTFCKSPLTFCICLSWWMKKWTRKCTCIRPPVEFVN